MSQNLIWLAANVGMGISGYMAASSTDGKGFSLIKAVIAVCLAYAAGVAVGAGLS